MSDKAASQRFTQHADLLSEVINAGVHGVIVVDSENIIQLWNEWMEKASNIPPSNAIGKQLTSLFPSLEHGRITNAIQSALSSGVSAAISHAFDKTLFPLHRPGHREQKLKQMIYIKPISLPDEQRYCLIQICDTSAAVKREKQLKEMAHNANKARVAAEEFSSLKSDFVATVSHELRTPLTAIRGSLGLLRKGIAGQVDNSVQNLIDIANSNTLRLLMLITDILDIEKIESGRMDFTFGDVDIPTLLEQSLVSINDYGRDYEVTFNITHCPDIVVHGDMNRLIQVMNNLMSNAAKFEPKGGEVEIRADLIDSKIRIAVIDHGPGIPEDFHDKIFDKFTQADTSASRSIPGTGLGLAIAKAIIDKHKGNIAFNTSADKGTEFYFEIPINNKPLI